MGTAGPHVHMGHCTQCGSFLKARWRHRAQCGNLVGVDGPAPGADGIKLSLWKRIAGMPPDFLAVGAPVAMLSFVAFNIHVGMWPGHPDEKLHVMPAVRSLLDQATSQATWAASASGTTRWCSALA